MENYTDIFMFNGFSSERFNLIICDIPAIRNVKSSSKSYKFTKGGTRNVFTISNSYYDQQLEIVFTVAKPNFDEITINEERVISKWLDVDDYKYLCFVDVDFANLQYPCVCTSKEWEVINGKKISCELKFITSSPFAYTNEIKNEINTTTTTSISILNNSDEFEKIIPSIKITILENCNFSIYNNASNETTIINNCLKNEVIIMDVDNCELSSSLRTSELIKDFNKVWLGLYNDNIQYGTYNKLDFYGKAIVELKYKFIRKVVCM